MLDNLSYQGDGLLAARAPGTRTKPVVHEDHSSWLKIWSCRVEHLRCGVPAPVVGVDAPRDELKRKHFRHGLCVQGDNTPWWTPKSWEHTKSTKIF